MTFNYHLNPIYRHNIMSNNVFKLTCGSICTHSLITQTLASKYPPETAAVSRAGRGGAEGFELLTADLTDVCEGVLLFPAESCRAQ